MRIKKEYDSEFKINAVKLSEDIGSSKAAKELGLPITTLYGWRNKYKNGLLGIETGGRKTKKAMNLAEENIELKKQLRQRETELREKDRTIDILKEASIFFAKGQKK